MQLLFGNKKGALREIHAGSGYWSQDGAAQILATPEMPTAIWIRWPGGATTTTEIPSGSADIEVQQTGALRVVRKL
jgi:hypothetical protein